MITIKILHLFPTLMNLYGEYGNLSVLRHRLEENRVDVEILTFEKGDTLDLTDIDMVYIGAGTEKKRNEAMKLLIPYAGAIEEALSGGIPFLATGGSYVIFGDGIKKVDKHKNECFYGGLKIFPFNYVEGERIGYDKRQVGDVLYQSDFGEIVGFINRMGEVVNVETPLFKKERGISDKGNTEGFFSPPFYGTALIGPILAINPKFCDFFVKELLVKHGVEDFVPVLVQDHAFQLHEKRVALLRSKLEADKK